MRSTQSKLISSVAFRMPIKARPFRTQVSDVDVEGFFEDENFVFRFYGLITFRPEVISIDEDSRGKFAVLQETEISHPGGFHLIVATEYDSDLGCEWGYQVSLRRNEAQDRNLLPEGFNWRGVDIDSILITQPRQLTAVLFDPNGLIYGSSRLNPSEAGAPSPQTEANALLERIRSSATSRILFLPHAARQMSKPDRMITTREVHNVLTVGVVIEEYPDDPRGSSYLMLGSGNGGRPIHVVCSPKPDFLAIITAYLPSPDEWSSDFRVRKTQ